MMETGEIVRVLEHRVEVRFAQSAEHQEKCGHCGLCSQGQDGGMKLGVPVTAAQRARVAVGQQVSVELDLPSPYRAIVLLFVLPLAGLFVGAVAGQRWTSLAAALHMETTLLAGLGGVLGLAVMLAVGFVLERKAGGKRTPPRLILPEDEDAAEDVATAADEPDH